MPQSDNRVAVIGGGISGLTTAILLQVNDYRTFLYAKQRPSHEPDIVREPEFASLHAAASVLPHSVASPNVAHWTTISQEFFRALSFRAACGVRTQVHYEVFEDATISRPPYADAVENFEMLSPTEMENKWVPRRPGANNIAGWKFDVFFCEVPEYVRYLYELYEQVGGRIVPPEELPGDNLLPYLNLNYRYYINCTGSSAHSFIGNATKDAAFSSRFQDDPGSLPESPVQLEPLVDPWPPKLIRGHYLRVDIKEIMTGDQGRFFSYNYKPTPEIYQTAKGEPADVYCYPRSDAWILGGSRQEGTVDDSGNWTGEPTVGAETIFRRDEDDGELAVPSPIFDLNAELLLDMTAGRLNLKQLYKDDPSVVSPGVGYRFVRDSPSDSVRLAASRLRDSTEPNDGSNSKFVLHNYGHGGSGFTLSWGCAFHVLEMLDALTEHPPRHQVQARRRKFVLTHGATRMILLDLTARLLASNGH